MSKKPERAAVPSGFVTGFCGKCDRKVGQYLRHYEVVRCVCGAELWALQPTRNGPLKLFPHEPLARF